MVLVAEMDRTARARLRPQILATTRTRVIRANAKTALGAGWLPKTADRARSDRAVADAWSWPVCSRTVSRMNAALATPPVASGVRPVRRCARPDCADVAGATLAFRYDLQQAWLTPLTADKTPATYDLCGPCASRTAPPRGWELRDDRPDPDARAPGPEASDAVRDAIAAALRGDEATNVLAFPPARQPAAAAQNPAPVAPEPVVGEPVVERPASAEQVLPEPTSLQAAALEAAAAQTAAAEAVASSAIIEAVPAEPRVPAASEADFSRSRPERPSEQRVPRDVLAVRRRPVDVLITASESPEPLPASASVSVAPPMPMPVPARAALVTTAAPTSGGGTAARTGRSHAPTTRTLQCSSGLVTSTASTGPGPSLPPSPQPLLPTEASTTHVPAMAVAVPLAFDTLPDRLVSLVQEARPLAP
ncbi:MAG: hypothetical protein ACI867_001017 [Glaciecola sp.]|jgi:hypothetical protein